MISVLKRHLGRLERMLRRSKGKKGEKARRRRRKLSRKISKLRKRLVKRLRVRTKGLIKRVRRHHRGRKARVSFWKKRERERRRKRRGRRCGVRVRLLSRRVKKAKRAASRCGDIDSKCVDRSYKKVFRMSRELSKLRRKCGSSKRWSCKRLGAWVRRQHRKRKRLQRRTMKCSDEDNGCVQRIVRSMLKLGRKIKRRQRRCRREGSMLREQRPRFKVVIKDPFSLKNVAWKKKFTCVDLKSAFDQWLKRQRTIREYWHQQSCQCSLHDTSCIRMHYRKILHVQRRIRRNRNAFTRRISNCDECQGLKIKFDRWLREQRATRHALHLSVCKCPSRDHECMQEHVSRIKAIQRNIKKRRKEMLALHRPCILTVKNTPTTKAPSQQERIVRGMASAITPSMALVMALIAVLAAIF